MSAEVKQAGTGTTNPASTPTLGVVSEAKFCTSTTAQILRDSLATMAHEPTGCPFGKHRRTLPTHIELLCYSFLPVEDLACLYWTSKTLSAFVTRTFRSLKRLRPCIFAGQWLLESAADEKVPAIGMGLLLSTRFCESQSEVVVATAGEHENSLWRQWLQRMIKHNQSTLRSFYITARRSVINGAHALSPHRKAVSLGRVRRRRRCERSTRVYQTFHTRKLAKFARSELAMRQTLVATVFAI